MNSRLIGRAKRLHTAIGWNCIIIIIIIIIIVIIISERELAFTFATYAIAVPSVYRIRLPINEEMKGNAKCKNFRFEPPFGDLGVTYTVHLWLAGKRFVYFLLAIIEFFFASSHGCGTIK